MNYAEEVEKYVKLMNLPEEVVSLCPDLGMSKDEDGRHCDPEDDTSNACIKTKDWISCYSFLSLLFTCESLEEPVANINPFVAAESELGTENVRES